MKQLILIALISTFSMGGFFNNSQDNNEAKEKYAENEKLCKMFTKKVDKYKIHMRDDVLAKASLASYEHRAEIFCKKAEDAKKEMEDNNVSQ